MPHPVIDTFELVTQTVAIPQKHTNGNVATRYAQKRYAVQARREPASTKNPVREDGTRKPSPYYIKTMYITNPNSLCETSIPVWGWANTPASQVGSMNQVMGATKAAAWLIFDQKLVSADFRATVRARARTAFLNKLADASGKDAWSLGVMAGEFRETVGMATDLAGSLVSAVRGISKQFQKPRSVVAETLRTYGQEGPKAALKSLGTRDIGLLEGVVQAWLVKQFGLDPLVKDIHTATHVLRAKMFGEIPGLETFTARIRGGRSDYRERVIQTASAASDWVGVDSFIRVREDVGAHFSALYKLPVRPTPMQKLGLYNPALVGGELCRFSWMADYAIELTPWLRSTMAAQDTVFLEGTESVISKTNALDGYSRKGASSAHGNVRIDPQLNPRILSAVWFERTVLSSGVLPAFLPGLNNRMDVTKLANVTAALTTLVGGRSRQGPPVIRY